jgi:hypothetical protein
MKNSNRYGFLKFGTMFFFFCLRTKSWILIFWILKQFFFIKKISQETKSQLCIFNFGTIVFSQVKKKKSQIWTRTWNKYWIFFKFLNIFPLSLFSLLLSNHVVFFFF